MRSRTHFGNIKKFSHIALIIGTWAVFFHIVFNIHPQSWHHLYFAPFFIVLFSALALSIAYIVNRVPIIVLVPLAITAILVLRMFGIKDWLNPILIMGLSVTLIYFFTVSERSDKLNAHTSIKQTTSPVQEDNHADIKTST